MRAVAILLMAGLQAPTAVSAVPAAGTAASFAREFAAPPGRAVTTAPEPAASESAPPLFPVVPVPPADRRGHAVAWTCAGMGLALVGASFALHETADRRYDAYLRETDPEAIESRWRATIRADRLSTASLLTGEALLATAVYLRFVRRPAAPRVALAAEPGAVAVTVRW